MILFAAVTATATSLVFDHDGGDIYAQFKKTNTGEGNVALQTNSTDLATYKADPTANWVQHDLEHATKVASGKLTVPATDPWGEVVKILGIPRGTRVRWVFTKSSGTVAFSGWAVGQ
jgi:hypothetical protein